MKRERSAALYFLKNVMMMRINGYFWLSLQVMLYGWGFGGVSTFGYVERL